MKSPAIWRFASLVNGTIFECDLFAYWEVASDPMSDSFDPNKISAEDLLTEWAAEVEKHFTNKLVPIYWSVRGSGCKAEAMPFQHGGDNSKNFLHFYDWPVSVESGEPINWVTIPVVDKHWNGSRADKGGFIQQATGWKPAILQPFVYLPTLLKTRAKL